MDYGLEVCPLSKTNLGSLDFPINRFFIKLILILTYRIIFGLVDVCMSDYFQLITRSHGSARVL